MTQSYTRAKGGEVVGLSKTAPVPWLPRSHSGRRFVIVAGLAVLVIWGLLYLVFREWRAGYRERAAYGASQVVPAIDPIGEVVPPGVEPAAWLDAVRRTHDMLMTVISSNLLGIDEMRALRAELDQTVSRARSHPETAVAELAEVWNTIADRAAFLFKDTRSRSGARHPRPPILPERPARGRPTPQGNHSGTTSPSSSESSAVWKVEGVPQRDLKA